MSKWVLIFLVSPPGSLGWEKLNPIQGLTQPLRKDPASHFLLPIFLKEPILGLPGQGPRWGHWDVSYTPKDDGRKWDLQTWGVKCPPSRRCEGHMFSPSLLAMGSPKLPECGSHLGEGRVDRPASWDYAPALEQSRIPARGG